MSTVAELDTEIEAAVIAQTQQTQRMISDYNPESGEQIPAGAFRFRQRVDVIDRESVNANVQGNACIVEIDWMVHMEPNGLDIMERDYTAGAWLDQLTLVDGDNDGFWKSMAAVHDVSRDEPPTITTTLDTVGQVLKFTVTAQLVLQF